MLSRFKVFAKKLKKEEHAPFQEVLERFCYLYRITPNGIQKVFFRGIYSRV